MLSVKLRSNQISALNQEERAEIKKLPTNIRKLRLKPLLGIQQALNRVT